MFGLIDFSFSFVFIFVIRLIIIIIRKCWFISSAPTIWRFRRFFRKLFIFIISGNLFIFWRARINFRI